MTIPSLQASTQNPPSLKRKRDEINEEPVAKKARTFAYIHDQYTEKRGNPVMLEITCAKCHQWVMDYQKDGPGRLLRLYLDRIYHPQAWRERFTKATVRSAPALQCTKCQNILADPFIYRRQYLGAEERPAYQVRVLQGIPQIDKTPRIRRDEPAREEVIK